MEANETSGTGRRFWSRRKVVVAIAAIGAVVLLAGLLVAFSAPKNELLTEMPTNQSRLRFLGPLRQPVSAAWQRFRKTWSNPPPKIAIASHIIRMPQEFLPELGDPVLTNQAGVKVWILDPNRTKSVLNRPGLADYGPRQEWTGLVGSTDTWLVKRLLVQVRPTQRSKTATNLEVGVGFADLVTYLPSKDTKSQNAPARHRAPLPFGVRVTVPKGSSLLILGPTFVTDWAPRFCTLFIPE